MPRKKAKEIVKKVIKKKKPKKKLYFGPEVQDAIVRYNQSTDHAERNKIYGQEIHKAFDKLCENIINTFKFTYFDDPFEDVKHEVTSFLVMNLHKYDHTKGSKAFSYFSIVAKNYLILHNNANYKKYKSHDKIEILNMRPNRDYSEKVGDLELFVDDMIRYFEYKIPVIFNKGKNLDIAYALLEILKSRHSIEEFNKKAIYILVREMTDVKTSDITKVVNIFKLHYKKLQKEFYLKGHIDITANKFF